MAYFILLINHYYFRRCFYSSPAASSICHRSNEWFAEKFRFHYNISELNIFHRLCVSCRISIRIIHRVSRSSTCIHLPVYKILLLVTSGIFYHFYSYNGFEKIHDVIRPVAPRPK